MKINDALNTPVYRKIIKFFHENQASVDTSRGISAWIREDRSAVKKALEGLVRLEVVEAHRSTSMTGYSYTTDPKLIRKIDRLLKNKK
ncbi:hypothetical protein ACFL42_04475 [Candidatus Omnitrophota bacterium]